MRGRHLGELRLKRQGLRREDGDDARRVGGSWVVRVLELGAARGAGVGLRDDLDAEVGERAAGRVGVSRRLPLELERLQLLVEALVLEVVAL